VTGGFRAGDPGLAMKPQPESESSRMLKNSFLPRLLKKVQMSLDVARDRESVERQGGK